MGAYGLQPPLIATLALNESAVSWNKRPARSVSRMVTYHPLTLAALILDALPGDQ